jgi:hemerythrin-like metal-binding protein
MNKNWSPRIAEALSLGECEIGDGGTTHMEWEDEYLLGNAEVDRLHEEFVVVVRAVQHSPDEALERCYMALLDHLIRHFGAEDRMMVETQFPPRRCHMDEHAAVLRSAHEVRMQLALDNVALCRTFVAELVNWFPKHAQHLDSALVHWISKSRFGGKPLVFKRMARRETNRDAAYEI